MEKNYKYNLDKSSRKFLCPMCNRKTFVRFKDAEGNYASDKYGRCDREVNCGHFLYPASEQSWTPAPPKAKRPQIYIPESILKRTLQGYSLNGFLNNLLKQGISPEAVQRITEDYYLGTITKGIYTGAVCFPFIDEFHRINAIQVKLFNEQNKTTKTNWIHSILASSISEQPNWLKDYYKNESKVNCLFGIHLLHKYPNKKVIIAESPKNAITGSLFLPEFLWLASGSLGYLNAEKFKALKGKDVMIIPDTSTDSVAFDQWSFQAEKISKKVGLKISVTDFLESIVTEEQKSSGFDIADYFLQQK